MKAVLISIKPKYCELIASGKKTVEVRKTRPKLETPFKVYIYQTKESKRRYTDHRFNSLFSEKTSYSSMGKVIGEFVCDWVVVSRVCRLRGNTGFLAPRTEREKNLLEMACLTLDELKSYVGSEFECFCGWHISDLVIYDKPRELSEFKKTCNHKNDCCTCDRYDYIGHRCYDEITRPPQSWCYVEEAY